MGDKEKNYSKYMFKGTSVAFIAGVATGALGLVMRMFLSKSLTPADYGTFYAVFSLIGFFSLFRGLGLGSAIVKFLPGFRENEDFTSLKSSIVIMVIVRLVASVGVAGVFLIFAERLAVGYIGSKSAVPIIRVLSIWFIMMGLTQTGKNVFQAFKDIPSQKSISLIRMLVTFIGVVILAYIGDLSTVETAIAFLTGVSITVLWVLFRLLQKYRNILSKGNLELSKQTAKKLIYFGAPLILASLAGTLTTRVDTMVITFFRTPEEVGYYQVARPATRIISQVGIVVGAPLFPMIAELWAKEDFERLRQTLYYVLKLSLVFLIPVAAVIISFPEEIIRVLFSPEFLPATQATRILTLTMVITVLFNVLGRALVATGKNILRAKVYGLAAILNVIGDIILVPLIGIEGAAIAFLVSFLIALLVEIFFIRKQVEFNVPLFDIGKALLGGVGVVLLVHFLKIVLPLPFWFKLFAILFSAGFFYPLWILRTRTLTPEDLTMLRNTLLLPEWIVEILRKLA